MVASFGAKVTTCLHESYTTNPPKTNIWTLKTTGMHVDDAIGYVTYVERSSFKDTYFAFPNLSTTNESDWVVLPLDGRSKSATKFQVTGKVNGLITVCRATQLHAQNWSRMAIQVQYRQRQGFLDVLNEIDYTWEFIKLEANFGERLIGKQQSLRSSTLVAGVWRERRPSIRPDDFWPILDYVFNVGLVVKGVREMDNSSEEEILGSAVRHELKKEEGAPDFGEVKAGNEMINDLDEREETTHCVPELINLDESVESIPRLEYMNDLLELMEGNELA